MKISNSNVKRILLISIFLIQSSIVCFSQSIDKNEEAFVKSFQKNFRIPNAIKENCAGISTLLNISFDSDLNTYEINFSDNASKELKLELKSIYKKLEVNLLRNYLKESNLSNGNILFPVNFISRKGDCKCLDMVNYPNGLYSLFDGELLKNPSILRKPILIYYYDTIKN